MTEKYFTAETDRYPIRCKAYITEGRPEGVILGVHGFAGDKDSSTLKKLAEASVEKGVFLICFDFPAHGESDADPGALTVANCMRDVTDMADLCRREYPEAKKYLFATSFGGYICLLCSSALDDFQTVLRAPAVTMAEHVLTDALKVKPEEFAGLGRVCCGFDRKIEVRYEFWQELQEHRLSENCPCARRVLVIHGDRDEAVPYADAVSFCEKNKNAVLMTVKGAGHRFKGEGETELVIRGALSFWGL